MVLNLLFFTVKIERTSLSAEQRLALHRQREWLKARDEAFAEQAAQQTGFHILL